MKRAMMGMKSKMREWVMVVDEPVISRSAIDFSALALRILPQGVSRWTKVINESMRFPAVGSSHFSSSRTMQAWVCAASLQKNNKNWFAKAPNPVFFTRGRGIYHWNLFSKKQMWSLSLWTKQNLCLQQWMAFRTIEFQIQLLDY